MSSTEVTCPDLHKCRNGAECKEDPAREGTYYCDCSNIASSSSVYAGLACEHESTVFCNPSNDVSHASYCANGGTCVKDEDENGVHYGCDCGDGYTGDVRCVCTRFVSIQYCCMRFGGFLLATTGSERGIHCPHRYTCCSHTNRCRFLVRHSHTPVLRIRCRSDGA